MNNFEYQEYFTKGCLWSLCFFLICLFFVVFGLLSFIKIYKNAQKTHEKFLRTYIKALIPFMVMALSFVCIGVINQTLKYGIKLIGEKESDAIEYIGRIEAIEEISLPPRYVHEGDNSLRTAVLKIDGIKYYCMSADDLTSNDTIHIRYLPKSKVILSYQKVPYSEWETPVMNNESKYEFDPLFMVVFTVALILFALYSKSQFFDQKLVKRISEDEKRWQKNEIRFHHSYIKQSIVFGIIIIIAAMMFLIAFQEITMPLLILIALVGGGAHIYDQYKNWHLAYNDQELIFYSGFGRKETISKSSIIRIEETLENAFLAKGKIYRLVIIQYRTKVLGRTSIQTIKLDYRFHIGISRFLDRFGL